MKRLLVLLCLLPAGLLPAAAPAAPTLPDSAWILDHVRYLADPRLEGRGVGTLGLEYAAEYLEKEFRELGLAPAGERGGYRQAVEVVTGVEVTQPTDLTLADGQGFELGKDFVPFGFSASGEAAAPVAFAGYGITAPEYAYDDYAGLDVKNRFALVLAYEPGEMDTASRFGGDVNTPHSELRNKAINAREHGALGILVVAGPRYHKEEDLTPPRADAGYMSSGLVAARVTRRVADRLLAGSGEDIAKLQESIDVHQAPRSLALADSLRLRVALVKKRAFVHNIVGLWRGADSTRAIVVGAHYDHLGLGGEHSLSPKDTGKPHVGADDNASGTAAMLAVARAWSSRADHPRRDLVFCAFAGEELGVIGSAHYVGDPPRPIAGTDAMLNFDMVGRLRERRLTVMGTGTAVGLDSLVRRAAAPYGFDLKLSEDGYGPSDQSSFYKAKVPVLMFFTGAHADYHKPSDTWEKIDAGGIARIATLAYDLTQRLDGGPQLAYRQAAPDSAYRRVGGGSGYGATLGTIPDYSQSEGGVLIADVREGGPAAAAGMLGGDIIVAMDGVRIDNIYDFTYALRTRRPGRKVAVSVLRGGEKLAFEAVLGKRGESR